MGVFQPLAGLAVSPLMEHGAKTQTQPPEMYWEVQVRLFCHTFKQMELQCLPGE